MNRCIKAATHKDGLYCFMFTNGKSFSATNRNDAMRVGRALASEYGYDSADAGYELNSSIVECNREILNKYHLVEHGKRVASFYANVGR